MATSQPQLAVVCVGRRSDGSPKRIRAIVYRVGPPGETRQVWRIQKPGRHHEWLVDDTDVQLADS